MTSRRSRLGSTVLVIVCAEEMREWKMIDVVHTHVTTLPIFLENQVMDYHEPSFRALIIFQRQFQFQFDASC